MSLSERLSRDKIGNWAIDLCSSGVGLELFAQVILALKNIGFSPEKVHHAFLSVEFCVVAGGFRVTAAFCSKLQASCLGRISHARFVPESVLREDDLNYESIKIFAEKTLGIHNAEKNHHVAEEEIQLFDSPKDIKYIFSLLDEMTNEGLFSFAEILTSGSAKFHRTEKKMKKIIKEFLPKLFECRDDRSQIKLKQLSQLLMDPRYFSRKELALSNPSQSFRAACIDVLGRLEELSFVTLSAMYRNLRGVKGYTPKLLGKRSGWSLERLIKQIRNKSMQMMQEFRDGDEPPEPLSKALAVAHLMLKPELRTIFSNVSPDIEMLQTDIMKAIQLVQDKRKISHSELKKLHVMLDPDAEASERSFRVRITMKNLLTEYLLECSNMDTIPKELLETVRIINRTSHRPAHRTFSAEEIQEEVNCLLNVSAHAKQIVWDSLPENEFDKDFADAYMDDVEESCDESGTECQHFIFGRTRKCSNNTDDIDYESQCFGETSPVHSESCVSLSRAESSAPPFSPNSKSCIKPEAMHIAETNSVDSHAFLHPSMGNLDDTHSMDENGDQARSVGQQRQTHSHASMLSSPVGFSKISSCNGRSKNGLQEAKTGLCCMPKVASSNRSAEGSTVVNDEKSNLENEYLIIQEACDETSMFACSFVDHVLNELEAPQDQTSNAQADAPGLKNSKVTMRRAFYEEDSVGSIMINALELLMPSFPRREEEVRVLMGI